MTNKRTFNVEKYKLRMDGGKKLSSFAIAELEGPEELDAIQRGGSSGVMIQEQLVAQAIVEVNGEAVPVTPFTTWSKWPSRTREFVRNAYQKVNGASTKELEDFDKAGFEGETQPEPGDSD